MTALADRYTGRHIRLARNGAWMQKKRSRSRPGHANLPAAAALTISGFLIGGAGAVLQFGGTGQADPGGPVAYDPANYPTGPQRRGRPREPRRPRANPPGNGSVRTTGTCLASYDDSEDLQGLKAATSDLPANAIVRVTNPANGKSVEVLVTAGSRTPALPGPVPGRLPGDRVEQRGRRGRALRGAPAGRHLTEAGRRGYPNGSKPSAGRARSCQQAGGHTPSSGMLVTAPPTA